MSRLVEALGWRVVWLPDLDGDIWLVSEARIVLVDVLISADGLEDRLLEQLVAGTP